MKLIKSVPRLLRNILYHLTSVFVFAIFYHTFGQFHNISEPNNKGLSIVNSIYFSLTTQTTVGYGGISPSNETTKFITMAQMGILLLLVIGQFKPFM